jgi:3-methyladenine DNA glycosylase AlkD
MTASDLEARLRRLGDPHMAQAARRYFKCLPGDPAASDVFVGLKVGPLRQLAREYQDLPLPEIEQLLLSTLHEGRLLALLILVRAFGRGDEAQRQRIHELYLKNTTHVNNWDLVDASAEHLVGGWLWDRSRRLLDRLARSPLIWDRRIAIVATYHFIKHGQFDSTLRLAAVLRDDPHDLIHKTVGWMLREVSKRDQVALEQFLRIHYQRMPRTMLRYAIERFEEGRRQHYLKGTLPAEAAGEPGS